MHNAHYHTQKSNGTTLLIFSAPICNFVHNEAAEARGISVTYEPGGCESIFDTTNCVATYTYLKETANCSCTRDDTTVLIECFSDLVANLIAGVLIITTPAPTTPAPASTTASTTASTNDSGPLSKFN